MPRMKVLIAAAGTGGHLFPAAQLAEELQEHEIEVLFAGAGLSTNRCFPQEKYRFYDIASATPFHRSPVAVGRALWTLGRGVKESILLLRREKPALVVGFGSFHSFPLLLAARLARVPLVLFESNAFPGKVNRLFSSGARMTATHFSCSAQHLKGKVQQVQMPMRHTPQVLSAAEARRHFGLKADLFTLLVFGGSQGASVLNERVREATSKMAGEPFQVIHCVGNAERVAETEAHYRACGIPACVKEFEREMQIAYQAATLAVTRAGAATLAELTAFAVPAILIPYPHAADDHQNKNGAFFAQEVKGMLHFRQEELTGDILCSALRSFLDPARSLHADCQAALIHFHSQQKKDSLCALITRILTP